jgi:hypothetical protein
VPSKASTLSAYGSVSRIEGALKALQHGDGQPSYQKTEDSGDQVQRNEKIEKVEFGM